MKEKWIQNSYSLVRENSMNRLIVRQCGAFDFMATWISFEFCESLGFLAPNSFM